jgi:hypothetical protein
MFLRATLGFAPCEMSCSSMAWIRARARVEVRDREFDVAPVAVTAQ